MRLTTKFNLVLFSVFSLGLVFAGYISYTVLHKHAREEVLTHAGIPADSPGAMGWNMALDKLVTHLAGQ